MNRQADQKKANDRHSRDQEFMVGQQVMAHKFFLKLGPSWIPGTIVGRNVPLSYVVQVNGVQVWKRHTEHLQEMGDTPVEEQAETRSDDQIPIDESESFPVTSDVEGDTTTQPFDAQSNSPEPSSSQTNQPTAVSNRYPSRTRKPPKHYRN